MNSMNTSAAQPSDRVLAVPFQGYDVEVRFDHPRLTAKWVRFREDDTFASVGLPSCLSVLSDEQAARLALVVMDSVVECDRTGRMPAYPRELMYSLAQAPGVRIRWLLDNGGCLEPSDRVAKAVQAALWTGEEVKVMMTETGAGVVAESRILRALVVGKRIPTEKLMEAVRRVASVPQEAE